MLYVYVPPEAPMNSLYGRSLEEIASGWDAHLRHLGLRIGPTADKLLPKDKLFMHFHGHYLIQEYTIELDISPELKVRMDPLGYRVLKERHLDPLDAIRRGKLYRFRPHNDTNQWRVYLPEDLTMQLKDYDWNQHRAILAIGNSDFRLL